MSDKQQPDPQTDKKEEKTQETVPAVDSDQKKVEDEKDEKNILSKTYDQSLETINNLFDWKIFFWEMLGTALFAYGICASDGQDWYVAMSLFAGILIVSPFSGGHLNPAVSFGFFIKNGIIPNGEGETSWEFREFLGRSLAQFLGACIGGALAFSILAMSAAPFIPSDDWRMLGGYFTGEAFGTCLFVLTILIMTDEKTKLVDQDILDEKKTVVATLPKQFKDGLVVVATIALALYYSRSFTYKTGGGLNPGIAVGLQIWFAIDEESWEPLIHSWLFVVGPLVGALVAAYYYSLFHLNAVKEEGCFAEKTEDDKKDDEENKDENKDQKDLEQQKKSEEPAK